MSEKPDNDRVALYLTRPAPDLQTGAQLLVADGSAGVAFTLPETMRQAGEHPCEAADRLTAALVAAATGGPCTSFAYRKVAPPEGVGHAFVTEAVDALPDQMGTFRWIPLPERLGDL